MVVTTLGEVKPLYTVKMYSEKRYRVVKFKRSGADDLYRVFSEPSPDVPPNTDKLENSLSRTRSRIIELGLCNDWDCFFTGTLNETKIDRFDLAGFRKILSQWIRDRRKAYGTEIKYLLVPEFHQSGAIHVHGFLSGIPADRMTSFDALSQTQAVPVRLLNHGFFRWDDFDKRFGFCSMAPIRDRDAAAFYICKYVSKDLCQRSSELGAHLFWASQNLRGAVPWGDCYVHSEYLDQFLTHDYDFCSVGWIRPSEVSGLDWSFDADGDIDPRVRMRKSSSYRCSFRIQSSGTASCL